MNGRARRDGQGSWTLSILLHLVIVAAIAGIWYWMAHRSKPVETLGIEAHVVSGEALQAMQAPAPQPEPEAAPAPDEQPPEPQPETPPVETGPTPEELAAQAAEEKRVADEKRVTDEKHVAEERRLAAEREVADRKAADEKAERDRKDRERKDKEKADREKAERDKAEKDKADKAERDRVAREKADKAEKDKVEQARKQREDELSAQLAAEDQRAAARNSAAMAQYVGQIASRIERAWNRPPNVKPGIECELHVTQVPGGAVTSVKVGRCNADEATRQSIEAAAYRASPLPTPPDPALFERDLVVTFRPE